MWLRQTVSVPEIKRNLCHSVHLLSDSYTSWEICHSVHLSDSYISWEIYAPVAFFFLAQGSLAENLFHGETENHGVHSSHHKKRLKNSEPVVLLEPLNVSVTQPVISQTWLCASPYITYLFLLVVELTTTCIGRCVEFSIYRILWWRGKIHMYCINSEIVIGKYCG